MAKSMAHYPMGRAQGMPVRRITLFLFGGVSNIERHPTVPSGISVNSLVKDHIMGTDDHAFPVVDNGSLVGMVTLEDARQVDRGNWDTRTVSRIMTPVDDLISIESDEDAAEALNKLRQREVRQLPVLSNGKLSGLLRRRDIIQWLQLQSEEVG